MTFFKGVGITVIVIAIIIGIFIFSHTMQHADKIATDALINYEDFQEMYNACQKLDKDLAVLKAIPETDKMFEMVSKSATLAAKKQILNRWIEEYNGKSKMWNRNLWKSSSLPYQLSTNDFPNY